MSHKWVKDSQGKQCSKCGSRINTMGGRFKYVEVDKWGISEPCNWYPRCNEIKSLTTKENKK